MVFCNEGNVDINIQPLSGHNPYFNRWFSAIGRRRTNTQLLIMVTILILIDGFLQYVMELIISRIISHNPYFNRWFSAIIIVPLLYQQMGKSQSLF